MIETPEPVEPPCFDDGCSATGPARLAAELSRVIHEFAEDLPWPDSQRLGADAARAVWAAGSSAPVPASQSVPAVPVSSTGGKETGEDSADVQGAAEVDWTEEPRFADFREAYDYATIHFSTAIRAHAKVARREAYQIWHTIQLGMEKIQRERSPLPDSETEPDAMQWGYREHVGEDVDPVREEYARFRAQDEHLKLVQREVRYGPWIEVTS